MGSVEVARGGFLFKKKKKKKHSLNKADLTQSFRFRDLRGVIELVA